MEAELNGRLIKLDDDGELYWWFAINGGRPLKTPRWKKFKFTLMVDKKGNETYHSCRINTRNYLRHRVVYFIHNTEWNILDSSIENQIDHIDENKLNNNIENLRIVTHQQNQWNISSYKGYILSKHNTYRTNISCGEAKLTKTYKTEQEAIDAVNEFKLKYHQF